MEVVIFIMCFKCMCVCNCSMFVSSCSQLQCVLLMFVVDTIGDYIVETYSSIGFVMALYVESNISLV